MKNKIAAFGVSALMLASLSGCGGAGQPGNNAAGFIGDPIRRVDNAVRAGDDAWNGGDRTAVHPPGAAAALTTQHVQTDAANRQVNVTLSTDWTGANGRTGAAVGRDTRGYADATGHNGTLGANGGAAVDPNHRAGAYGLDTSALLITVPTGWTVNVLGATDRTALAIVPYNFRAGRNGAIATANSPGTAAPATPVVNGTANGMVFRATTPGQYAVVHRTGAVAGRVLDVITVSSVARVPSVSTTHTWGTSNTVGTANTTVAY